MSISILKNNKAITILITFSVVINVVASFSSSRLLKFSCTPSYSFHNADTKRASRIKLNSGDFIPLAREGDWSAYLDDNTGFIYYFNKISGESRWEAPTSTFPKVKLTLDQMKSMKRKQSQYIARSKQASQLQDEQQQENRNNFAILDVFGNNENDGMLSYSSDGNSITEAVRQNQYSDTALVEEESSLVQEAKKKTAKPSFSLNNIFKENSEKIGDMFSTKAKPKPSRTATEIDESKILDLITASSVLPHPEKVSWGGEDAILCKTRTFGVFDGVSGADKLEGLPLYSETLSEQLDLLVGSEGLTLPQIRGYLTESAQAADAIATGASTALVCSVSEEGTLNALNLGDSVLLVIRNGSVFARTKEIVHFFDCPYQLSDESPDRPKDATKLTVKLKPDDIIVLGSDGIFDNLSEQTICELVAKAPYNPRQMIKFIVNEARKVSFKDDVLTPYSKVAKANGYEEYSDGLGGKVDDISGVVALCK